MHFTQNQGGPTLKTEAISLRNGKKFLLILTPDLIFDFCRPSEMFAVFAEFDQSSPSSDVFEVEIKSKNIHPEFNPKLGYHDIALLTLTKPVTFSVR